MRILCLFLGLLLASCAASAGKKNTPPEPWRPQAPLFFGVSMQSSPRTVEERLLSLGYERESWRLEAPYTHMVFCQKEAESVIPRVEVRICNHPWLLAAVSLHGGKREPFSDMMRTRFQLGIAEWESNAQDDFRKAAFVRDFAAHTRVYLSTEGKKPYLVLEARDVMEQCHKALAQDLDILRRAEQAEKDARALQRTQSF